MKYAEDAEDFKNTVNEALHKKLLVRAYTLDNITEASFTKDEKAEIKGIFFSFMGDGDIAEISTRIATFDYECKELKYAFNLWFDLCFDTELESQINMLKAERND